MKVSSEEKDRTRIKILNSAVDVITEKGFKSASMREISRHAQVGDATIYNYFPSKEKLLYGYCEHVQQQVLQQLKSIDNFHEYTLHEQLQQLVDLELQTWLPAREFLQQVYSQTFAAPVAGFSHLAETRRLFSEMVTDMLAAAIEVEEIPEQPYQELLPRLFWDYMSGILSYWLRDDSEGFSNTTRVVDSSMEIVSSILYQGLVGKSLDLVSLIFRTHVLPQMGKWKDFTNDHDLAAVIRLFMEKDDDS
jgi:AcrR family transcriptional regulator